MTSHINRYSVAFSALCLIFVAIIITQWNFTWDDSAITLGFSKQFVITGDIRPTEFSDRVDGTSSLFWMLLHSLYFAIGFSPSSVLLIAKSTTVLLTLTTAFILWSALLHSLINKWLSIAGAVLFLFSSISIIEALNGMEIPFVSLLVLVCYLCYVRRGERRLFNIIFLVTSTLLILVRHEGVWLLLPFCIAETRLFRWRTWIQPSFILWCFVFIGYHAWHYLYFGSILTNPMIAKKYLLYSAGHSSLSNFLVFHFKPVIKFAVSFFPLFACVFIKRRPGETEYPGRQLNRGLAFSVIAFIVVLSMVIGEIPEATNRRIYPAITLLILLAIQHLDNSIRTWNWHYVSLALISIGIFLGMQEYMIQRYFKNSASLKNVQSLQVPIEFLQDKVAKQYFSFAGPDIGGILLYIDHLRLLDLGLLCNKPLAAEGYSILPSILEREKPDIIITHGVWTELSRIDTIEQLYSKYSLVSVKGKAMLIRCDLLSLLRSKGRLDSAGICLLQNKEIHLDERIDKHFHTVQSNCITDF